MGQSLVSTQYKNLQKKKIIGSEIGLDLKRSENNRKKRRRIRLGRLKKKEKKKD